MRNCVSASLMHMICFFLFNTTQLTEITVQSNSNIFSGKRPFKKKYVAVKRHLSSAYDEKNIVINLHCYQESIKKNISGKMCQKFVEIR
jgi:hypothetical protein